MASEVLAVPEENLAEVIRILRAGMHYLGEDVPPEVRQNVTRWCVEEQEYLDECFTLEYSLRGHWEPT